MSKALPIFKPHPYKKVYSFMAQVLTNPHSSEESHLRELIAYDDHHYRAVFDPAYFVLREGETAPSKSQWNTLKKKLKRHDRSVFVFKSHGWINCEEGDSEARCGYLDFGFPA